MFIGRTSRDNHALWPDVSETSSQSPPPLNLRRKRVEVGTKVESRVVIHLWSPKSCKWFVAQRLEAVQNNHRLQAVTSVFVREIQPNSEEEAKTFEISDYSSATQMLTILVVDPKGMNKAAFPTGNMEAFQRHWIGFCEKCYIRRNPIALTTIESSYKVSPEIIRVERETCQLTVLND